MKGDDISLAVILFGAVMFCLVVGMMLVINIKNSDDNYVLWCIDKNGIEKAVIFQGINEDDINAVSKCRDIMFEPVDYRITKYNKEERLR